MIMMRFDLFSCSLPKSDYSCEQKFVSLSDIMNGNYGTSSPLCDHDDCMDDFDDDYDDECYNMNQLDHSFEDDIYQNKNEDSVDSSEKEVDNEA